MFFKKLFIKRSDFTLEINQARRWIQEADSIVVGIGDRLSVAGGIDYTSPHIVREYFIDYYRMGYKSLTEIQNMYRVITDENVKAYWGYWARYIKYISYEKEVGNGYKDLLRLIRNKNYMIYTTTIDSQVQRAGFEMERICAIRGDGRFLKCSMACCNKHYEALELLEPMIKSMEGNLEIKANKVPRCPQCGAYLIPEIQEKNDYVETYGENKEASYKQEGSQCFDFIDKQSQNQVVLIELGMDVSSEVRSIFEMHTKQHENIHLIRVHDKQAQLPEDIGSKAISIKMNLEEVVAELASGIVSL